MNASFSHMAKEELCRIMPRHEGCVLAEIAAACQASGSLAIRQGRGALEISAEMPAQARRLFALVKEYTGEVAYIRAVETQRLNHKKSYVLSLDTGYMELLNDAGIWENGTMVPGVPKWISRTCCARAYMRSLFLFCGSVVDPKKAYHLEFVLHNEEHADGVIALLEKLKVKAKKTVRKAHHVVYMKDADSISDFFAGIGAHEAMMEQESIRILKEVRNHVNRTVNFETANLQKTVDASGRQVDCIRFLSRLGFLERLPQQLRQAAEARLSNPEATILELAEMMSPPVSKSGMNHRLRKLCQMAEAEGYAEKGKG